MKKLLCYLGILVLLFLTVLPPLLRIMLPDQDEIDVLEEVEETTILSCLSDSYLINTRYVGEDVKMVVFKQLITEDVANDNPDEEIEDDNLDNPNDTEDLDILFDTLKQTSGVTHNVLPDGEVVGLDFSIYEFPNLELTNYTKKITDQQTYYESLNFTCTIRK